MSGYHRLPYREDGFVRYGALSNIEAHLQMARRNLRRAQRELAWLQALRDVRAEQDRAGSWPRLAGADDAEEYWNGVRKLVDERARGGLDQGPVSLSDLREPGQ